MQDKSSHQQKQNYTRTSQPAELSGLNFLESPQPSFLDLSIMACYMYVINEFLVEASNLSQNAQGMVYLPTFTIKIVKSR